MVAALLCGLLAAAGCDSVVDGVASPAAAEAGGSWTVLVYSIADTDLEEDNLADLVELSEVGGEDGLTIEAFVDRSADHTDEGFLDLGDWVGAKEVVIGYGSATELSDLGEVNTGDPAVLRDFITRGLSENPADHYALVLADHGSGWTGIGGDGSAGEDVLDLAEVRTALAGGLAGAGVDRLDLLGMDACLMATYETASAMAPYADRFIASEELEPSHGWDYTSFGVLLEDPAADVDTLGTALLDGYLAQAEELGTDAEVTLSLVDLTMMPALDLVVADFAGALAERAAAVAPVVGRERETVLGFARDPDPESDAQMADLGMLAAQIGVEALDVSDQADRVVRAVGDAVVATVAGSTMTGASGLSVYFPPTAELMDTDYASLTGTGAWNAFLDSYYAAGDAIPATARPTFADDAATYEFGPDGLSVTGSIGPDAVDNVAWASISYGVVAPDGSVLFYGEEPAEVADDGSGEVSALYDLTTMVFTDGAATMTGYLDLTYDDEAGLGTADVPVAYYEPGAGGEDHTDVTLSIVFDTVTGELVSETYYAYEPETGNYGELDADPTGLVVPKLYQLLPDGTADWVVSPGPGLSADLPSLGYDFVPMESGTGLHVELGVTDFGDNGDTLGADVVVP